VRTVTKKKEKKIVWPKKFKPAKPITEETIFLTSIHADNMAFIDGLRDEIARKLIELAFFCDSVQNRLTERMKKQCEP
jgi:hypothetical protein